jgi:hypothetical protein
MGDSLLACLMMICSNNPSLHEKEEVEKFLLAVVARFKAFKKRVPSYSNSQRPQRASASKAKSSVLSQLSGLENVVFNDFIDDELDSEDLSEQRASASLPDSVPIESEEERAAREADEMAALDSVGDYEADPNVMLEDVHQDIVIKTLKVFCESCPANEYREDNNITRLTQTQCTMCPRYSLGPPGSNSLQNCECNAGFIRVYTDAQTFVCGCEFGRYIVDTQCKECGECVHGYYRSGCLGDNPGSCVRCDKQCSQEQ